MKVKYITTPKGTEKNYQNTKMQKLPWIWWDSYETFKRKYTLYHISSNIHMQQITFVRYFSLPIKIFWTRAFT